MPDHNHHDNQPNHVHSRPHRTRGHSSHAREENHESTDQPDPLQRIKTPSPTPTDEDDQTNNNNMKTPEKQISRHENADPNKRNINSNLFLSRTPISAEEKEKYPFFCPICMHHYRFFFLFYSFLRST